MAESLNPPTGPHEGEIRLGASTTHGAPSDIAALRVRFERYPGCQQLVLRLPSDGWQGYGELLVTHCDGRSILRRPVREVLGGQVQILLDTLEWPPGAMTLEVTHDAGWSLRLALDKSADGRPVQLPQSAAEADPGDDLKFRAAAQDELVTRFTRRVEFVSQGRAGQVLYVEGAVELRFDWEFLIDGVAIDVPSPEVWERHTGVPLHRREEILRFIAETAQREQAPGWAIEIGEREIVLSQPRG